MKWSDASHPVWALLRTTAILGVLTFVLWLNAEHFDNTEIRTILTMFFGLLGVEGVSNAVSNVASHRK